MSSGEHVTGYQPHGCSRVGQKMLLTAKVLGQMRVNCRLPKFLMEIRGLVSGVPVEMTEDERKQGTGDEKGICA